MVRGPAAGRWGVQHAKPPPAGRWGVQQAESPSCKQVGSPTGTESLAAMQHVGMTSLGHLLLCHQLPQGHDHLLQNSGHAVDCTLCVHQDQVTKCLTTSCVSYSCTALKASVACSIFSCQLLCTATDELGRSLGYGCSYRMGCWTDPGGKV